MMTEQELLNRIAELEAENEQLRKAKEKHSPISLTDIYRKEYPWFARIHDDVYNSLTKLVRSVCFRKTQKPRKKTYRSDNTTKTINADYLIQTKDMTPEQAELFIEVCGRIIKVLDDYQIVAAEFEERTGRKV